MKITKENITVWKFENGDLLIGYNINGFEDEYFVNTSDGIFVYSADEMKELYNFSFGDIC